MLLLCVDGEAALSKDGKNQQRTVSGLLLVPGDTTAVFVYLVKWALSILALGLRAG